MSIPRISSRENDPSLANIPDKTDPAAKRVAQAASVLLQPPVKRRRIDAPLPAAAWRRPPTHLDRFIPPRAILNQPGPSLIHYPKLPPPQNFLEHRYRRGLTEALFNPHSETLADFDSQRDAHDFPILRIVNPKVSPAYQGPPYLKKGEIYPASAQKILDAPGFENDFYHHPAAYSPQADQVAIIMKDPPGNGWQVFLYNPASAAKKVLYENPIHNNHAKPISVAYGEAGEFLVVGKQNGAVEAWSVKEVPRRIMRILPGSSPIQTVAVHNRMIFAGDRNGKLYQIDPKTQTVVKKWKHPQGICAIVFSPNGKYVAIGMNENQVVVRDAETFEMIQIYNTKAAVRAIAFNPLENSSIAIGGGHADSQIFIYNLRNPEKEPIVIPMGSQVTNILWGKNRLFTTHLDGSYRVIPLSTSHRFPVGQMQRMSVSDKRILFACIREKGDQRNLILASADETLSFYNLPV